MLTVLHTITVKIGLAPGVSLNEEGHDRLGDAVIDVNDNELTDLIRVALCTAGLPKEIADDLVIEVTS